MRLIAHTVMSMMVVVVVCKVTHLLVLNGLALAVLIGKAVRSIVVVVVGSVATGAMSLLASSDICNWC